MEKRKWIVIIVFLVFMYSLNYFTKDKTTKINDKPANTVITKTSQNNIIQYKTLDVSLDILQALNDYHASTVITPRDYEKVSLMQNIFDQNKYLESGNRIIAKYINNSDEIIQLSTFGMTKGAETVIKANNNYLEFLKKMDFEDPNQLKELEYAVAKYQSDQKEGYKLIVISAPQIAYLIFEPAKSKNPTGDIPYKITKEERTQILDEIDRLFGKDLKQYQEDVKNEKGDYNTILFTIDSIQKYLIPDKYEDLKND